MLTSLAMFGRIHRDLRLFLFSSGCTSFAYAGVWLVLFNLYVLRLGYGPEFIGLMLGINQLTFGLAALPAGAVGAALGSRQAVILGYGSAIVLLSLTLLSERLPLAAQPAALLLLTTGVWAAAALFVVNSAPYVMQIATEEERPHVFALQQAIGALFGFLGAVLAGILPGLLAGPLGVMSDGAAAYNAALWLTPLAYCPALVAMMLTRPTPPVARQVQSAQGTGLPLMLIAGITLIVMLQSFGENIARGFFNVFLDAGLGVPTDRIGILIGVGQLLSVVTALLAPAALARWGAGRSVALVGGIGGTISLALLAMTSSWMVAGLAFLGMMCTISIAATARIVFSQEAVLPQWRTAMASAFTMGMAVSWSVGSVVGGFIIADAGYTPLFLLGAAAALLSSILVFAYLRIRAKKTMSVAVE